MTTISAKIVDDSVSMDGIRLTTMQLRYPRCIHAEFMTHRVFSRNASSSRAIPVERLIQDVLDDPFVPLHWGRNEKGMQASEENDAPVKFRHDEVPRDAAWLRARDQAVRSAKQFAAAGYHKQLVNRLLEPFGHINVVVTATEWQNFFALRDHPAAEPHIAILAREMKQAMDDAKPTALQPGDWHLPYVTTAEWWDLAAHYSEHDQVTIARRLSVARCASVSYKTVDGQPMTLERATDLYDKLETSGHWSPFEHQATPDVQEPGPGRFMQWLNGDQHGNLRGWRQFRKMFAHENADLL